jgi:hypothetical protein
MKTDDDHPLVASGDGNAGNKPEVIYGYDRLTIFLDYSELPLLASDLERHCKKIVIEGRQMKNNARWKCCLNIFQPTRQCLVLLAKGLGHDVSSIVTYVEIACDLPGGSKRQLLARRNSFLESAKMRYQHQEVVLDRRGTTYYYGRRTDGETRRPNVLAVYADRPSKLNNARPPEDAPPCLHIEWRVTGSAALAAHGIVSLDDLIQFHFLRFLGKNIRFYQIPKPTPLGVLLAKACGVDHRVSGSALRKRAAQWRMKHSIDKNFVMHNALRDTSAVGQKLAKKFETISFAAWLEMVLSL